MTELRSILALPINISKCGVGFVVSVDRKKTYNILCCEQTTFTSAKNKSDAVLLTKI